MEDNLQIQIDKYAKYVVQQSRSNLTKGKHNSSKDLWNSIRSKVSKTNEGFSIEFFSKSYGAFIDQGVKGKESTYPNTGKSPFKYSSKMPPPKSFLSWIKKKGIKGRDKKSGRFITNKSLSFLIARGIFNKGIRRTLFFTKPFEKGIKKYELDMLTAFVKDSTKQIID